MLVLFSSFCILNDIYCVKSFVRLYLCLRVGVFVCVSVSVCVCVVCECLCVYL